MAKRRKRTNANVPAKGRLRDLCDQLWSLAVRADWLNKCAVCGKGKCEAHHLIPRQHEATRYEIRNGIALCSHCHQFNKDLSPHQNAAGWMSWLFEHHPQLHDWMVENHRPVFDGTKNTPYYCGLLRYLRQYVEGEDFERICGIKFSRWLEENE